MSDRNAEETQLDIAGVGLPEDTTLAVVESAQRVWNDGDTNGIVMLRMITGAVIVEAELYPDDARALSEQLRLHADRATTMTSPHLQAFNGD